MSKRIDLTGQRFAKLVVISHYGRDSTGKTTWLCQCDCGNQSVVTGINLKTATTKSCGCQKHRRGADNPRTITDPARLIERKRKLATVRRWRKETLMRDGMRCVKCGSSHRLEAHHIVGFAESLSQRTDPANGVTLCHRCHMAYHLRYGRKSGFNEANLAQFLVGLHERPPIVCLDPDAKPNALLTEAINTLSTWRQRGVSDLLRLRGLINDAIESALHHR